MTLLDLINLSLNHIYQDLPLPVPKAPFIPVSVPVPDPLPKTLPTPIPLQAPTFVPLPAPITDLPLDDITKIVQEKLPSLTILPPPREHLFLLIPDQATPLELTFFDTLEKAIREKLGRDVRRAPFKDPLPFTKECLVLAPTRLPLPANLSFQLIFLEDPSFYQNAPSEKRSLWFKIQAAL